MQPRTLNTHIILGEKLEILTFCNHEANAYEPSCECGVAEVSKVIAVDGELSSTNTMSGNIVF